MSTNYARVARDLIEPVAGQLPISLVECTTISQAISMRRIADVLEDAFGTNTREDARREFREVMSQIEMSLRK